MRSVCLALVAIWFCVGPSVAQEAVLSLPKGCAEDWRSSRNFAECAFYRRDGTKVAITLFQRQDPVRKVTRALKIKKQGLTREMMEQLLLITEAALSDPNNHPPDLQIITSNARPERKRPGGFDACISFDFDFRYRGERSDEHGLRCMKLLPKGKILTASSTVAWQHKDPRAGRLPGFDSYADAVLRTLAVK